jgi:hypothetical protein
LSIPCQRRAATSRARRCLLAPSVTLSSWWVGLCLSACALPGPPRPARALTPLTAALACPSIAVIGGSGEGLRLDVTLPPNPAQDVAALPSHLVLIATADGVTASERMTIRLDGRLDPLRRAGGTLPLLDAAWPQDAAGALSLRALLIMPEPTDGDEGGPDGRWPSEGEGGEREGDAGDEGGAAAGGTCEGSAWAVVPAVSPDAWPAAPTEPPRLDPLGVAVTLRLPEGARRRSAGGPRETWRIFRRALSDTTSPGEVIATGWDPALYGEGEGEGVFVDVSSTPGSVYAYSVAREVEVAGGEEASLQVVSARSPEGYAVLAPPPTP